MKKVFKVALVILGLLVAAAIAASFHPEVRNVMRAMRPSTDYDAIAPALPGDLAEPAVLVFTKTNGYRHSEAIEAGLAFYQNLAQRRGWSLFATENGAVFAPELLAKFRVVVWHNASGAPLDAGQRAALKAWIEDGGGFVAVHAATDNSHAGWPWYQREFVGATFIGHTLGPQFQEAVVHVEQPEHPAMARVPSTWRHTEEWYSFDRSVRGQPGVNVLATVDESTYSPRLKLFWSDQDLAMGDHPVIWTRETGAGRGFFTVLGHSAAAYQTPEYQSILEGAIDWAGRFLDDGTAGDDTEAHGQKTNAVLGAPKL